MVLDLLITGAQSGLMSEAGISQPQSPLVWFISGASAGFGRAQAEVAVARGDSVVATARDESSIADLARRHPEQVLCLRMDVTDTARVAPVVDEAVARMGRIDVLMNNAGHGLVGALEELSDADIHTVLDVNVLGVLTVTRAVLPHMRGRRGGHIVQMSSVGGVVANPGHGMYATSKFALEGMSEALAGELAPFGIGVTIVEPGPFRTEFAGRSMGYSNPLADYADTSAAAVRTNMATQHGSQPNDPRKAAEIIADAVHNADMPLRLPLGPEATNRIRAKLRDQLADIDRWEHRLVDTGFDG